MKTRNINSITQLLDNTHMVITDDSVTWDMGIYTIQVNLDGVIVVKTKGGTVLEHTLPTKNSIQGVLFIQHNLEVYNDAASLELAIKIKATLTSQC